MDDLKIEIENGMANIYSPYNTEFVAQIKKISGRKWEPVLKCWSVPENFVNVVREIMQNIYGFTDITENETLSLKVFFNEAAHEWHSDVILFGKTLAHATGRNSGARVGDDVAYIKGEAVSGGSLKNWESIVRKESIVFLTNVNKNIYEKEKNNPKYDINIEVVDCGAETDKESLLKEKKRLLKRIEEIDKILQS